jgi:hypothetical protein
MQTKEHHRRLLLKERRDQALTVEIVRRVRKEDLARKRLIHLILLPNQNETVHD